MVLHGEHEGDRQTKRDAGRLAPAFALAALIALGAFLVGEQIGSSQPHPQQQTPKNASSSTQTKIPPDERIAEYTELLAWFTGLLAVVAAIEIGFLIVAAKTANATAHSTGALASAAALQARAAVAAEFSELLIVHIDLVQYPDALPGMPDIIIPPGGITMSESRVVLTIKNVGRTRSRIHELCVEWLIIDRAALDKNPDPPKEPIYTNKIGISHIFDSNQILPLKWSGETNSIIRLNPTQITAINNNDAWLWVYGFIKYSDFLRDMYDMGFAAHWEATAGATIGTTVIPVPRGFVLEGPPAYNYRRKNETET